jgi:hypothetical protein
MRPNRLIDYRNRNSLVTKLRSRRFALFRRLLSSLPRPVSILDVGGTEFFWETMGFTDQNDAQVVLLNLSRTETKCANFESIVGDARDLSSFHDEEFDVVFSNSVIEHLGCYEDQARMANEVQRVGRCYFVQTPNRYFPIEPHFVCPFFQFFPEALQLFLVQHFRLGWYERLPDEQRALEVIGELRLLTPREVAELFPGATIWKERLFGLTKSLVIYKGWDIRSEQREGWCNRTLPNRERMGDHWQPDSVVPVHDPLPAGEGA